MHLVMEHNSKKMPRDNEYAKGQHPSRWSSAWGRRENHSPLPFRFHFVSLSPVPSVPPQSLQNKTGVTTRKGV